MNSSTLPSFTVIAFASGRREWLSHRLNRFLYAHIALVVIAGLLPMLTPGDAFAQSAPWWLLHAVLYAVSLSALLLGLSSAHAEADEFVWLLGQPAGIGPWLAGKSAALISLVGGSALLLGFPCAVAGVMTPDIALTVLGATGVSIVCTLVGFSIGFWIRDTVRGLIGTVAVWFLLLFGTDLLLLAIAGTPLLQATPGLWVAPLLLNPLDAYRVTVLFAVEHAAFSGLDAGQLAGWWIGHSVLWLVLVTTIWSTGAIILAWLGARRRLDG